jgi:hypothetical protein
MGLWKRIREWVSGISDEDVAEQARVDHEQPKGDEGLPHHYEEVAQPRQFPPPPTGGGSF